MNWSCASANLPARGYASHGESLVPLALALRLAAYELLRVDGDDPVLILDDVFAELDPLAAALRAGRTGGGGRAGGRDRCGSRRMWWWRTGARYDVGNGKITRAD